MSVPHRGDASLDDAAGSTDAALPWRPLSARRAGQVDWHDALFDDVPEHLGPSLMRWIDNAARTVKTRDEYTGEVVERINRRSHRQIAEMRETRVTALVGEQLEVIDILLSLIYVELDALRQRGYKSAPEIDRERDLLKSAAELQGMLTEAGSLWRVQVLTFQEGDRFGLAERVTEIARERAELVLDGASSASIHLRRAWTALYGRHPDFAKALDEAGQAIEAVAMPVICPNDAKATLSKAAKALRDGAHKGKWTCAFGTLELLAERLQAFYGVQQRHGVAEVADMKETTREVAEAAVHEAITLVHWFRSGVIARAEAAS